MGIRDQGYKLYQLNPEAPGSPPFWTIALSEWRLSWGLLRTKLLFIFLMIVPVVFMLLSFGDQLLQQFMGKGKDMRIEGLYEYAFGYLEVWMIALMMAASGCGVVADDMRYKTIQLIFSKSVTKADYIAGKLLALVMLGALVTVLPYLLVGGLRVLLYVPKDSFQDVLKSVGMLGVYQLLLVSFLAAVVMALSCLTYRKGYVVLTFLGALLVPSVISKIAELVYKGEPWTELLSVVGNLASSLKTLVGYKGLPQLPGAPVEDLPAYMGWAPFAVLAALLVGAGAIIHWRTSKLEGIA
jgi:ABC-type transport system involved in multi-copper enzyme maturation permease subunit